MKKLLINIILLLASIGLQSQVNLVPNWSFEIIDTCPFYAVAEGQLRFAKPWFDPNLPQYAAGTDLLSTCSTNSYTSIPNNSWGYQFPKTDSSMVLLAVFGQLNTPSYGAREYISVRLNSKLNTNSKYRISFFCNLANKSRYAVKNVGLYFSQDSIALNTWDVLPYQPQIINDYYLTDTLNWMEVKGYYIANGDEEFINIGNFFDNAHTDFIQVSNSPVQASYYYIDDVSVTLIPEDTVENFSINVFPNPAQDEFYIACFALQDYSGVSLALFDMLGRKVKEYPLFFIHNKAQLSLSGVASGMYYYSINQNNNNLKSGKIIIVK